MYYHGHRYYAAWLGRWERPDPIGLGDGGNRWEYVGGRPVGSGDPTGLGRANETYYYYDDRPELASVAKDAGFTSEREFEEELNTTAVNGVAQLQIGEGEDTRHVTIHMRNRGAESVSFSGGYLDPVMDPIAEGLGSLYMNGTPNGWILSWVFASFPEAAEVVDDALGSEPVKVLEDVIVAKGATAAFRGLGKGALAGVRRGATRTVAPRTSGALWEGDEVVVYGGVDPETGKAVATVGSAGAIAAVPDVAQRLVRFDGPKPRYHVNPEHALGFGLRPGKTPLPKDAEEVFKNAVPNDPSDPKAWFGRSANGQIYRFSDANDGTAHFSGIVGIGDGARNYSAYARKRLEGGGD